MTAVAKAKSPARLAFAHFVRTGIRLSEGMFGAVSAPLEAKFNPYHDPTNGQFTFGPGGAGNARAAAGSTQATATIPSLADDGGFSPGALLDGVYRPGEAPASLSLAGAGSGPRGIGGNYSAFLDPMTLDQAFPGLSTVPGGSIIAVSANILDLTGPATELTNQMSLDYTRRLIADIKEVDPSYHFDSLGFPETLEGQIGQINDLRWDRAAAMYRASGDAEALQVETLRYLQDRTDAEYVNALAAAKAGRLQPAPTERMAIGNFVDKAVKADFRDELASRQLSGPSGRAVYVSSREYDSSGDDLSYSIPDARVGGVAFDMTLAPKTIKTSQIRRFFNSDFRPSAVVIIRPRQLGSGGTYVIKRPGK